MKSYNRPIDDIETIEDEMPNISDMVKEKLKEFSKTGRIKEMEGTKDTEGSQERITSGQSESLKI